MSVACDFCHKLAERHDDIQFVAAPSGLAHICEGCVEACRAVVAARKAEAEECSGA